MAADVYILIPGFLGFDSLGDLPYFAGVEEAIGSDCRDILVVPTLPTSSLPLRAKAVVKVAMDAAPGSRLHLIGHSTGGVDARLAAQHLSEAGRMPCSVVTIAAPHQGTPLAEYAASAMGQQALKLTAGAAAVLMRRGRLPLQVAVRLGEFAHAIASMVGFRSPLIEQVYEGLLRDLPDNNRAELLELFEAVAGDASLVFQLTREALDVLNAVSRLPQEVRCGSVVAMASVPRASDALFFLRDPVALASFWGYRLLHGATGRGSGYALPSDLEGAMRDAYAKIPSEMDSDGVVPTLSQVWETLIDAVWADHLDVIGHYGGQYSADTMPSRCGFGDAAFDHLWQRIADFCERNPTVD